MRDERYKQQKPTRARTFLLERYMIQSIFPSNMISPYISVVVVGLDVPVCSDLKY